MRAVCRNFVVLNNSYWSRNLSRPIFVWYSGEELGVGSFTSPLLSEELCKIKQFVDNISLLMLSPENPCPLSYPPRPLPPTTPPPCFLPTQHQNTDNPILLSIFAKYISFQYRTGFVFVLCNAKVS